MLSLVLYWFRIQYTPQKITCHPWKRKRFYINEHLPQENTDLKTDTKKTQTKESIIDIPRWCALPPKSPKQIWTSGLSTPRLSVGILAWSLTLTHSARLRTGHALHCWVTLVMCSRILYYVSFCEGGDFTCRQRLHSWVDVTRTMLLVVRLGVWWLAHAWWIWWLNTKYLGVFLYHSLPKSEAVLISSNLGGDAGSSVLRK